MRISLVIVVALALGAQATLTASSMDLGKPSAGVDQVFPLFQALEPCKFGRLAGEALYAEDFEAGIAGWTKGNFFYGNGTQRPNLWHWSTFAGNNTAMDLLGHGGPGRLYYGMENEQGGSFNTDPYENRGDIRSPTLAIPAGTVAVNLNTKWHVEWDRPTRYDGMMFGYYEPSTGTREMLCFFGPMYGERLYPGIGYYANSPSGSLLITGCKPYPFHHPLCNDWDPQTVELLTFDLAPLTNLWEPRFQVLPSSLAGRDVQFAFYFLEGDALINDATGWMIDDVEVVRLNA